ncbi:MAG: LysR family transcriptional regulator [Ruminococcus sp.]|nr:LysR family transcriptional regulator [Ruminococcus sp.]
MNLNYFKEFIVLAETKNYWEASERLFINQSTLSKHIKAMESELGVALFDRTTRKVELTEFGQTLLPYARSINRMQAEYTTALLQKQNQNLGLVTLGSISSMKQYRITDLISNYQSAFPDYNLHVLENDSRYLKQMLLSKKCELAFLREPFYPNNNFPEDDDSLIRIPYITDHLVAVIARSNPLSQKGAITLRDLEKEKLCFIKKSSILYNLCYAACQDAGFVPNIVYDSHYMGSIFDMIVKSGCVGLLTNKHIEHMRTHHADGPLTFHDIEPQISTRISLAYLANSQLSEGAAAFVSFFQEQICKIS